MQLQTPSPHPTPSDDNLIPMINVVFLLLIFFMVAGTIRTSDPLPITVPLTRSGAAQTAKPVLYIEADGTMTLNETPITTTQLAEELAQLIAVSVDSADSRSDLSSSSVDATDRLPTWTLAIKADADTSVALLRQVLGQIRTAGIHTVELVTVQASARP